MGCSMFSNCTLNNSKYVLNEGPSMVTNSVLTYLKNNLIGVVVGVSVALGYNQASVGWSALAGLLGATGDVSITSWLNVANHNHVGFGSTVGYTLLTLFKYVTTALTAHQIGSNIYSAFHPNAQVNLVNNPDADVPRNIEVEYQTVTETKVVRHITDTTGTARDFVLESRHCTVNGIGSTVDMRTLPSAEIDGIYAEANQLVIDSGGANSVRFYDLQVNEYGIIVDPFQSAMAHIARLAHVDPYTLNGMMLWIKNWDISVFCY